MKLRTPIPFLFFLFSGPILFFFSAEAAEGLFASVFDQKAFIWDRPGFSWRDCRDLDSEAKYYSEVDKKLTKERAAGSEGACENRGELLSEGDNVKILTEENNLPVSVEKEIITTSGLQTATFYHVQIFKNGAVVRGWMAADQLTKPHLQEKLEAPCPPVAKGTNTAEVIKYKFKKLAKDFEDKLPLGPQKTDAEVDKFVCHYNQADLSGAQFDKYYEKFRKAGKDAAAAFGMPYPMIMCTMLTESGMKYRPEEVHPAQDPKKAKKLPKTYRGYGQFGSQMVTQLAIESQKAPYTEMLRNFKSKHPNASLTDKQVRDSEDPTSAAAAIALSMRWMYDVRLPKVGCKDCSTNYKFNRKDLYMLVAGYDWSPFQLNKVADRSPGSLRMGGFPPPAETKHYMTKMDRCLSSGHFRNFNERGDKPSTVAMTRTCK